MELSLERDTLARYYVHQLNSFFPDVDVTNQEIDRILDDAIARMEYCFKHVKFARYNVEGRTIYNHLYADHNVIFNWILSNVAYRQYEHGPLASKFYYLNKIMHAFDCMYDTKLPDIFLVFHGAGTMLGKAEYDDYFVCLQGCTVGSHNGAYPKFGKGVALTANTSVIGGCNIGNRVSISTRASVFEEHVPSDSVVYLDRNTGRVVIKTSTQCYSQQFFNTDLKSFSQNE